MSSLFLWALSSQAEGLVAEESINRGVRSSEESDSQHDAQWNEFGWDRSEFSEALGDGVAYIKSD